MTAQVLTIIILLIFFAAMTATGIYCRRHAVDVEGFVLAKRSVGPWLTAFAFGTSYFSAVVFVGYAGQFGWNFGLASTWIGLGNAFIGSLLAWNVLGRRTRIMTQHTQSRTMPDFFGKRFASDKLKVAASFIVFIFLIPYTASLYNGLSSLFHIAFDIPYWIVIVIMAGLTCFYVMFGGYMATAINDFIQGIIMLAGIVAVIVAVLSSHGGLMEAVHKLSHVPSPYQETAAMHGAFTSFFGTQPIYLFFVIMLTSLGTWGLPQMVGKFYSITNEDAISKGTIISTLFAIVISGGSYFLGAFGRLYDNPALYSASGRVMGDAIVPFMLSTLPQTIIAIVIVLVLAASMSTLSSLVLTSSSTLTLDVIVPWRGKSYSEREKVIILRLFIAFFIIVSAVIAVLKDTYNFSMIAQMMGISWGALAGAFLAPFMYGLFWKGTTRASVWACFIFAPILMIIQMMKSMNMISFDSGWLNFLFTNSLYSGVIAMLGGLVIVPVVSMFTKKLNSQFVDNLFACYDKTVSVNTTTALGDEK